MILSGLEIQRKAEVGQDIIIDPFHRGCLNPNSYNLKLHNQLFIYKNDCLDMKLHNAVDMIEIPYQGMILEPGRLYLGRTWEYTETRNYVPMLEGRSSMGRLGLCVHVTAGFGDIGFRGYWTLELHCIQPVKIYPFVEICQIYYHMVQGDFVPYISGKYQDNKGIQESLLYKEFQ